MLKSPNGVLPQNGIIYGSCLTTNQEEFSGVFYSLGNGAETGFLK